MSIFGEFSHARTERLTNWVPLWAPGSVGSSYDMALDSHSLTAHWEREKSITVTMKVAHWLSVFAGFVNLSPLSKTWQVSVVS